MTLNRECLDKLDHLISDAQGLMICVQTMSFGYGQAALESPEDVRERNGLITLIDVLDGKVNEIAAAHCALRAEWAKVAKS